MNTMIGHYAIVSELGRGGMGVVYKAFEPALSRYVAIKVLSSTLAHDPGLVERFQREARSMAALNDPHILHIHYIGQEVDQPYFAMEFVDGESLSALLNREGPLSVADSLRILYQAARGLSVAHDAGVIHRDIKPSNLLISQKGQLKIADFGIALAARDTSKKLTASGDFIGTPGYLSPEVCLGKTVDARSDLFALGIVLFEMLCKRLPFEDDSPLNLMLKVVQTEVPNVCDINRDVDPTTLRILSKLLAKNPDERYQTAHQLLRELEQHPNIDPRSVLGLKAVQSNVAATVVTPSKEVKKSASLATIATPPGNGAQQSISAQASSNTSSSNKAVWLIALIAPLALGGMWWLGQRSAQSDIQTPVDNNVVSGNVEQTQNTDATSAIETKPSDPVVTKIEPAPSDTAKPNVTEPVTKTETAPPVVKPVVEKKPDLEKVDEPKPTAKKVKGFEVNKYGEVYLGKASEEVALVDITGQKAALMRVSGINHPWDGRVLKLASRPAPRDGADYYIQHNGGDWVMLVKRKNYQTGDMNVFLYVPDLGELGKVELDRDLSKQLNTQELLDSYKD
jgi:eukaryotic-like serine/threonine-protein kinase